MANKTALVLHTSPTSFGPPWTEGFKNSLWSWMKSWTKINFSIITNQSFSTQNNITLISIDQPNETFWQKILYTVTLTMKARKLALAHRYDYIFFNINSYNIIIPLLFLPKKQVKFLLILGSERLLKHLEEFKINLGKSPRWLVNLLLSKFDGIITVSKKLQAEVGQLSDFSGKTLFFPPNILVDHQKKLINHKKIAQKYNFSPKDFILLYIGNLHQTRGAELIVQALHQLKNPSLKLLICWNGIGDIKALRQQIRNYQLTSQVSIVGKVKLNEVFAIADVFVLPLKKQVNILEYPLTILESFIYRTPVICSKQPSFFELVKHRYNGLFFNHLVKTALAKQINTVYSQPKLLQHLKSNTWVSLEAVRKTADPNRLYRWLALL